MQLRFIERDEKKILQYSNHNQQCDYWVDVPLVREESDNPKEYWLVAGRYFESEHDAIMWQGLDKENYFDGHIVHVKEVLK